jgi:tetratricopeptide (TPR) repeat protein
MDCPSPETFLAFVDGAASADRSSVEAHLADCHTCRELCALMFALRTGATSMPTTAAAWRPLLSPCTRVGRYLIVEQLGAGAMGNVYSAYDPELDRRVAIKLIRSSPSGSADDRQQLRARLLREAQALARINHANVVNVFDAGEYQDDVFIAMELVDGTTLAAALRATGYDWRQRLALVRQAGEGLAAAHRAGVVHRDFKPDNVLVGRDGQVKVADFGLARAAEMGAVVEPDDGPSPTSRLDERLTQTGARVGTPAYMSPEQHLGRPADARSDQFSFCVVTWQALFDAHPFLKGKTADLRQAVLAGAMRPPSRRRGGADPTYARVLGRGLHSDPAERFATMDELLDQLLSVPRARRRRGLVLMGATCALVLATAIFMARALRTRYCQTAAAAHLAQTWNQPRRAEVQAALTKSGKAYALATWQRVKAVLDGYAADWIRTDVDVCAANEPWTAARSPIRARTRACLDERRSELGAVVDVLARGDSDVVLRAAEAVRALAPIATCADPAMAPPPSLPSDSQTRHEVLALRERLASAKALSEAGKMKDSLAAARAVNERAQLLGDLSLQAEALFSLGQVQHEVGELQASESSLWHALAKAEASGRDHLQPMIWSDLVGVIGFQEGNFVAAEKLMPVAEASVDRFEARGQVRVGFLDVLGLVEQKSGHFDRAIARFNAAIAAEQQIASERTGGSAELYLHLSDAEQEAGHADEALAHARRALANLEESLGPQHPEVAFASSALCHMLTFRGRTTEAQAAGRRSLAILSEAFDANSPVLTHALQVTGLAYLDAHQPHEALPLFERAFAIQMRNGMEQSGPTAAVLDSLGLTYDMMGRHSEGEATMRRALSLLTKLYGFDHPTTARCACHLARLILSSGRAAEAQALFARALAADERTVGPSHRDTATPLTGVGLSLLARGRASEALALLERAQAIREHGVSPPPLIGETSFGLARALWETHGDHARARRLAEQARAAYGQHAAANAREAAEVQAWLAAHRS